MLVTMSAEFLLWLVFFCQSPYFPNNLRQFHHYHSPPKPSNGLDKVPYARGLLDWHATPMKCMKCLLVPMLHHSTTTVLLGLIGRKKKNFCRLFYHQHIKTKEVWWKDLLIFLNKHVLRHERTHCGAESYFYYEAYGDVI